MKAMLRTTIGKQLFLLAVYLTLYVICQTLLFKSEANSWSAALLTKPWLSLIYFFAAHIVVERIVRKH